MSESSIVDALGGEGPTAFEQRIHAESGSSVYAVINGDIHIRNGHPVYRLDLFPMTPKAVDADRARRQPSRLLTAESRVVPFSGRTDELRRLAAWRDPPDSGLSVLLIHGPGGQGKTRLAARFATDSAECGWTVWAARHLSDPTAALVVVPGNTGRALVVVVEYAERWPLDDLQLLLQNPLLRAPERARVLLISRAATSWWPALRHRLEKADVVVGESIGLTPLVTTPAGRREVFRAARDAFSDAFGVAPQGIPELDRLDGAEFESVLTLHAAALVAVDAHVRGTEAPVDQLGHSAYLLNREHDYWQSLYDHDSGFSTEPEIMARTVQVATMTQRQPAAVASRILVGLGIAEAGAAISVLADHGRCYPADDPDMALAPLYPDRLGEDFLALRAPGHGHGDYVPDPWALAAPGKLLELAEREGLTGLLRPTVAVLVEAAHRWPHVLNGQIHPILRKRPKTAVDAGGVALARLAEIDGLDLGVLEGIAPLLPTGRHVDLDVGAARVTQVLARARLATELSERERASTLLELSHREWAVGLHREALDSSKRAVAIYRHLAGARPDDFLPDLLRALHFHGIALSELKRDDEAVAVAEEVVALDRARDATTSNRQSLASSLHHSSLYLSNVARWEDSLPPAREAVDILRELSLGPDGADHRPDLAFSLDGLGTRLLELSMPEDAEMPMREALLIYRQLAEDNPNAYLPSLSVALTNLGTVLSELGRHTESLGCATESVDIDRRLAAANPGAYLPDLASSLVNLSIDLDRSGRESEAVSAARESLKIRKDLSVTEPTAYRPGIASSLLNLGEIVSNSGDRDGAFAITREAVEAYRALSQDNPALYIEGLARSLNALGNHLSRAGRTADAVVASVEAAELWRELCERNATAYTINRVYCLYRLGQIYGRMGRYDAAATATRTSVDLCRALVSTADWVQREALARSLTGLGQRMRDLGRHDEALTCAQEAVDLYRSLAALDPTLDPEELSEALSNLALCLADHGAHAPAAAAAREAVRLCEPLAERNPDYYRPELADRLTNLAAVLAASGEHHDEALASARNAVAVYGPLLARYPAVFAGDHHRAVALQADLLQRVG